MATAPGFIPLSYFGPCLVCFSGISFVGVDMTEGTCNERDRYSFRSHSPLARERNSDVPIEFRSDLFRTVILAIRTYAVWNKDKRVGIGLGLLLAIIQIPNGILAEQFLDVIDCAYCFNSSLFLCSAFVPAGSKTSLLVIDNPYPDIFRGCLALTATKLIFVNWVLFTVMEGGTSSTILFQGR
jgi:hypothetical protein